MTPISTWEQQVNFMRGMPPAAAKIIIILMLSGQSLTNQKLMFACDMSDKTIRNGLAWLEFNGLVQNNGKYDGWSLTAAVRQLTLNLQFDDEVSRKFSDLVGVNRKFSDLLPSSSSSKDLIILDQEEEERRSDTEIPISTGLDSNDDDDIRQMLVQAGIGRRSGKLREILDAKLDPDFVQAHIEARKQLLDAGEKYPVGWLITKLLDGDPIPESPTPLQQTIPEHLKDIIKR
jgi:predicted transcriptional regulator